MLAYKLMDNGFLRLYNVSMFIILLVDCEINDWPCVRAWRQDSGCDPPPASGSVWRTVYGNRSSLTAPSPPRWRWLCRHTWPCLCLHLKKVIASASSSQTRYFIQTSRQVCMYPVHQGGRENGWLRVVICWPSRWAPQRRYSHLENRSYVSFI